MKALLREWFSRLSGAFGRGRRDRDIEQELRTHLDFAEEDLRRQGMPPDAAAREARLQFGRPTQTVEILRGQRGIPPLSTFWIDTKLGLRMLRKHWALTLIGGCAMAAAMTVGAAVFNLLGTSLPLEEGDRVVIVQPFDPETRQSQSPNAQVFERWRVDLDSLVDAGAFRTVDRGLVTNNGPGPAVTVAEMSAAGFTLARVRPLMGRFLLPEDERPGAPPAVVIGYDVWRSTFAGDPGIVGQQIQLDRVPHTVIGVMPNGFRFPVNHQYWTSLRTQPSDRVTAFARLAPGVSLERAQAELEAVGFGETGVVAESGRPLRPFVRPYIVGLTGERSGAIAFVLPFFLLFLLVPPCVNIGALVFARTVARQGEFAARTALGASRGRIVTQIFLEVLVLSAAAAAVAIALAPKVAETLSSMLATFSQPFWMNFGVSYGTILVTAGLAVSAALIAGAIPAIRATGRWQLTGLHALNRSSPPRLGKGWTAIVVAQVALSVAVLPSAVELAWKMVRPAILGPGFPVKEFLTARIDWTAAEAPAMAAPRFSALSTLVAGRLTAMPGVTSVTLSEYKPFAEQNLLVEVDSSASPGPQWVGFNQVDSAFFDAFEIRLLAGRGFEPIDNDPQRGTILVNRSFVNRLLPGENPLGRTVRVVSRNAPAAQYEIVGLVDNQFAYSDQATIYRPLTPAAALRQNAGAIRQDKDVLSTNIAIRLGPASPPDFAMRLHEVAAGIDPALRVDDIEPLNDVYFFLSLPDYIFGSVPAIISLAVLLFAAVGIYTQMSFAVVQRRREIGIRSALGASPRNLVLGIFRSVFVPLSIGAGLGGVAALALDLYLAPWLLVAEGGRPLPWVLPAAEAFVLLMGAMALFGPVRRTLQVDATEALREG